MSVNVLLRLCKSLMVSILVSSVVYRGFDPLLVKPETIDNNICKGCFSPKREALGSKVV